MSYLLTHGKPCPPMKLVLNCEGEALYRAVVNMKVL